MERGREGGGKREGGGERGRCSLVTDQLCGAKN